MNWRYIKNEIKAVLIMAFLPSLFAFWMTAPIWWEKPGLEIAIFCGVFAVFSVIGIIAGICDDYKLTFRIERKKK